MLMRSPSVTYEVVDGRAVLVDPEGRELLTLNHVGTVVWEASDGTKDEQQLIDVVSERFAEVDRSQIERDVHAFLAELRSSGLVTSGD
jgi:hypothetical protein